MAPYIFLTVLVIVYMIVFAVRVTGPVTTLPHAKTDPPRKNGFALFSFLVGGAFFLLQLRVLVSYAAKIQALPSYLVESNRLLFTLVTFTACGHLMLDALMAPTRGQLLLILLGGSVLVCIFSLGVELFPLDEATFAEMGGILIVSVGVGGGVIHWLGVRRFRGRNSWWIQTTYLAPHPLYSFATSTKVTFGFLLFVGVMAYFAWVNPPLF